MVDKPDGGRNPWWDPMGMWQQMAEPFADSAPPMWAARNPLQALVDSLRSGLVGRPVVVGSGAGRVAFTLSSLEASVGHLAAAAGQADHVALSAEQVEWRTYQFATVSAQLRNVHTRFRAKPVLVSAPIDVSLKMAAEKMSELLTQAVPRFQFSINESGLMVVRHARRPHWGYVMVRPEIDQGGLVLRPTGVGRRARLWRFRRRMTAVRPKVALPEGVRIIGVDVHPDSLEVRLRVDEWSVGLSELASLVRK